jgi:hypothetical protein
VLDEVRKQHNDTMRKAKQNNNKGQLTQPTIREAVCSPRPRS